ncbi:MAG: PilZ domain-containing protein [Candidatus Omnitrophica bacterium]|nr:PilZ domain-containing protein [Candidatus Omnitrophota bacterium]
MKSKDFKIADIDSIDIMNIFKKGKMIIVASVIVTVAATYFTTKVFVKPVYEARAKILVREEKLNPQDEFPSYETGWQFAHSQAEIMKSKPVINMALQKIDFADKALSSIDAQSLDTGVLQQSIELRLLESTNVLELRVEQENPLFASMLANSLAEAYIENGVGLKSKTVERTISSLEQEIEAAEKSFTAVENELDKIASNENIIMLSGSDIVLDLKKYANLDMDLMSANVDIEMLNTKLSEIKDRIKETDPKKLNFKFLANSNILENLKSQIRLAELKLDILRGQFSLNHPEVIVARGAIDKLNFDLSKERDAIIKAEIESLEIEKKSLIGRKEAILEVHKKHSGRLNEIIQNQPKLARLNRDIEMKRGIYSDLMGKLQVLKVLKQRTNMLPDSEIIEFADTPNYPAKPNLLKNLLLGVLLGLTIGFAMAFISSSSFVPEIKTEYDFGHGTERRSSERTKTSSKITCTIVGEKEEYDCWGRDIGRSGMKIITTKKLQRNNILEFEIHRDKMKPIVGNGVVVWTEPVSVNGCNSEYAAGVKFYDLELDIKNSMV